MIKLLPLLVLLSCAHITRPTYDYATLKFDPKDRSVTKPISEPSYVKSFTAEVCEKKVDQACIDKYLDMIHARLEAAYPGAHPEAVKTTCRSYPKECGKDEGFLEFLYITLHNRTVDQFQGMNDDYGTKSLSEEWTSWLVKLKQHARGERAVSSAPVEYSSPAPYRQPTYVMPQAPQQHQYNTQCRTYSWGTDCETTGR